MNSNNLDKNNILNLFKEKNYKGVIESGLKLLKKNPKNHQLVYSIGLSYVNQVFLTDQSFLVVSCQLFGCFSYFDPPF